MHDILIQHLELKVTLTVAEKDSIRSFFTPQKIKKKRLLLQEGYPCKHMIFVAKGLLKAYNFDEKGNEHVSQLSPEGWWTSDMYSFFSGEPSGYSIDAIEDSEVLLITNEDFENLTVKVPIMDRYFRLLFQNSLITKERRLVSSLTHTAEERYRLLLAGSPDLIKRVPQNILASFLGLSAETVSRLKKNLLNN
jgi:CRP-like cAMP-binding protein